ncbi:hypothetical protein HBI84_010410 [Parastagonospora nodorum]|nr:hypothetical protein HBI84_010410 [Parastagonospora nodorum]
MLSFTDLPAEIRQRIISLNFPDTCGVGMRFPREIRAPLHTSRSLRLDTAEVLKTWSPIHYISHPKQLHRLPSPYIDSPDQYCLPKTPSALIDGRTYSPRLQRVCIDLFHDALEDKILWTCYCEAGDRQYSHHELVSNWADVVKYLPIEGINEVYVDVTPAPHSSRPKARTGLVIRPMLYDKRIGTFLACHTDDVGDLVAAIHKHYQGRAELKLTGNLSAKTEWFLACLDRRSNLGLDYVGKLYTGDEPCFQGIYQAVAHIVTKEEVNEARRRSESHPLAWLQQTQWSKDVQWTYAKLVELGEEKGVMEDLRTLVEFKVHAERKVLKFAHTSGYRQAFQQRAAKNLGGFLAKRESPGKQIRIVLTKHRKHRDRMGFWCWAPPGECQCPGADHT